MGKPAVLVALHNGNQIKATCRQPSQKTARQSAAIGKTVYTLPLESELCLP
ncbi:hypothetical protein M5D96_001753, partial [Drosophila gunungcola]